MNDSDNFHTENAGDFVAGVKEREIWDYDQSVQEIQTKLSGYVSRTNEVYDRFLRYQESTNKNHAEKKEICDVVRAIIKETSISFLSRLVPYKADGTSEAEADARNLRAVKEPFWLKLSEITTEFGMY